MPVDTTCQGIVQLDALVRPALIASLQELRLQPELIDYALGGLPQDPLTAAQYGQQEVDRARAWFLATNVPVNMARRLDVADLPCVTVTLLRSAETKNTLGDMSYKVRELRADLPWQDLTSKFQAVYDSATGLTKVPDEVAAQLYLVAGMSVVDAQGRPSEILRMESATSFYLAPDLQLDLSAATIRGRFPRRAVSLRSAYFDEQVVVGCHVLGDHSRLLWLHALVCFALLRGRRRYLEARGLDVSSISSSDLREADYLTAEQPGLSRYVTLGGQALHEWVDDEADVVQGVRFEVESVGLAGADDVEAEEPAFLGG